VIGTAANLEMGRMYEQMFRQAGIPVTAMMSSAGVEFYTPGSPAELWLEDDTLLEDAEVRQVIEDVLHGPERDLPVDMTNVLPPVEMEQPPTFSWPISWWILVTLAIVMLIPLAAFAVGKYPLVATFLLIVGGAFFVYLIVRGLLT
jgi:hypothetical protein